MHTGVMVGLVKDVDDPAGQGRVQLSLPTLGIVSGWAPVATAMAGDDRGSWLRPEVGDEALVGFDHGDIDHPYVLGYLWNGQDKPPETDRQNRVIKTPGGHQLRFEDKDGAKKVILVTAAGLALTMDDAASKVEVKCGSLTITLDDAQQSIALSGGGRAVTLQSGQVTIS